jgi:hypothetical protein
MLQMDRQTRHNLGILAWVALGLFLIYLGINLSVWIAVNLLPTLFCVTVVIVVVYAMFARTFQTAKPSASPLNPGAGRRNSINEQTHRHKGQGAYQSKNATTTPTHRTQTTPAQHAPARPVSRGNWRG